MELPLFLDRLPETLRRTGDGRSTHYKKIADGLFTPPVKISERRSGWPRHETQAIVAARIAGQNEDQIRELVQTLLALRSNLRTITEVAEGRHRA